MKTPPPALRAGHRATRYAALPLVAWLLASSLPSAAVATLYTVDVNGGGDFDSIQDAIRAATSGDEIIVAPGIYSESIAFLGKDLWLHSEQGAAVTTIDPSPLFTSCVIFQMGETRSAVLEGFTLTGGRGTERNEQGVGIIAGGAIFCFDASPRIVDCIIEDNSAEYAGGIYVEEADPSIEGCVFRRNSSDTYGGAIAGPEAQPSISNCTFEDNTTVVAGTVHLVEHFTITDCTFRRNEAATGAALNVGGGANVYRCMFQENRAAALGGAIRTLYAGIIVEDCAFVENTAGKDGGAIVISFEGSPA